MTVALSQPQTLSDEHLESLEALRQATAVRELVKSLREQIARVFVGQTQVVDMVIYALLAGGHVLIEGVPGLGKTLLVRTLADALHLPMSRIQFTPDLMPADITGTTMLTETDTGGHQLQFQPGPLISSIVLADEINRATPKTQSALLEAMQEKQVTVAGRTIQLPEPFLVLATQNPVEQEGTYSLPEAQLDRFLVKLLVTYPTDDEMDHILQQTTGEPIENSPQPISAREVLSAQHTVRQVPAIRKVRLYAIRLMKATHPDQPTATAGVKKYVALGAGPRAAQSLLLLAKVRALVDGRFAASCDDVRAVALPVLRHRLTLNFVGLADRVSADDLVAELLKSVPQHSND